VRWEDLVSNHLQLEASASNGVARIQQFSGLPAQELKRVF